MRCVENSQEKPRNLKLLSLWFCRIFMRLHSSEHAVQMRQRIPANDSRWGQEGEAHRAFVYVFMVNNASAQLIGWQFKVGLLWLFWCLFLVRLVINWPAGAHLAPSR